MSFTIASNNQKISYNLRKEVKNHYIEKYKTLLRAIEI